MPILPTDFIFSIDPTPIKSVLGYSTELNLYSSNINNTTACYNLSFVVTLPDGVSFDSATMPPTSITTGPNGSIILSFLNIKDLAQNEIDSLFTIKLKSDETFRQTGLPVPIDVPINFVNVIASADTLPRGNEDIGNQVITKNLNSSFTPIRYNLKKSAPKKMPKGAGEIDPVISPLWVYEYTLVLTNNTTTPSTVTFVDNLPNGVRYLDSLNVIGPDSALLSTLTVIAPSLGHDYYTLDWGIVNLSANSVNTITFKAAIWDNYTVNGVENSGEPIPHGKKLTNISQLNGLGGIVTSTTETAAMDATIDKSVNKTFTDVGDILNYTLTYKVNQYDNVNSFVIIDTLSNGQSYNVGSASVAPSSVTPNMDGTTNIQWDIGDLTKGTTGVITFTATVLANYIVGLPVVSDDTLPNNVISNGVNETRSTETPDDSTSYTNIQIPKITKKVIQYYYKDGTVKPMAVASPGDLVEFEIFYDDSFLNASVLNLQIDEFAPINMGPLTGISVTYSGTLLGPFMPFIITPNGLRWSLGTIPGGRTWIARFKIPVMNIVFNGSRNNLAKLSAQNSLNTNYSDRDQVLVNFGSPSVRLSKTLAPSGLLVPGSTYTYTVTISNPQNSEGLVTDAFNMDFTDIIPTGMTYSGTYSVTGTGSYNPPTFVGQNINMLITKLAPNNILTFKYNVTVDVGVSAGKRLRNDAQLARPYSQPDSSFQYPGAPLKASVSRQVILASIAKTSSVSKATIGEDFTYIVTLTVPKGTTVYAPQIKDTLPVGEIYVGPSTVQLSPNAPVPVIPVVVGQVITFPPYADITATSYDVTLIYRFVARIVTATHQPPYEEVQQNNVEEKWYTDPSLTQFLTVLASSSLTATTPNINLLKEQRNFTGGSPFTTEQIILQNNDVLHYRLTVTSDGASKAYSIDLTDVLSNYIVFDGIVSPPTKGVISIVGTQQIKWTINELEVGQMAIVVFGVKPYYQSASVSILNKFSGIYSSYNTINAVSYPADSNTVVALAPNLGFYKSVSKTMANMGETIRYYLNLTIPPGIVAYNVNIKDTLPIGQKYEGNAKKDNYTVYPLILGQIITFPNELQIGPFLTTTTIVYSFDATITSGPEHNEIETQTNYSILTWELSPNGPLAQPVESVINITITNKPPVRGITLEQVEDAKILKLT